MFKITMADGTSGNVFTVSDVTIAKVAGPPPRRAQNRSGFMSAFAVTNSPLAVTTSNSSA